MPNYKLVPIDDIELDRTNPRIQRLISMYDGEPNEEAIGMALGAGAEVGVSGGTTFSSLRASIKTNKGLIQPIIINNKPEGLVVIEGNTRLYIYKQFRDQDVEGNWEEIPAVVHENLDQSAIDAIRLQAHLVGPRDWDPYSKAKYLHLLHIEQSMPITFLIDYCGGKRTEVERYIQAYIDIEKYYRPIVEDMNVEFDNSRFSAFVEVQKPIIRRALMEHSQGQGDKEIFSKWVAEGRFSRLEDVRSLPRILINDEACRIFEQQDSRAALNFLATLNSGDNLGTATLEDLSAALAQKIRELSWPELQEMRSNNDHPKVLALTDAFTEVKSLIEMLED